MVATGEECSLYKPLIRTLKMEVDGVITTEEQPVGVTMDLEQEQEQEQEQQEHEEDEVENEDEEGVEEGVEEGDGGGDNENDESLEIDKKRKRRRSAVWDEFDEVKGTNKMQCKHCKAQLQISGGTTSHFRRHLKGCARRMTNQKSQKILGFRSGKITSLMCEGDWIRNLHGLKKKSRKKEEKDEEFVLNVP
ncbi:major centromere autoantigen B-like isoform X6 [Tripterygium wilfordii]|uniref:major centromere autoantigen B-like isoform X6 n=1 Tax=Tripterygium wilfordii TaxID=458696 RepID=UPI0018F85C69|nr:major centromere autoantigen B-like isoform X6 [Tripterygium wilfordii]